MKTTGQTEILPMPLLAHADLVLLLADLLRRPDSIELPGTQELESLLDAAGADEGVRLAVQSAVRAGGDRDCAPDTQDEYHRLFEGAAACPPNESAFIRRDKGAILADIMGFYRAFGFAPSEQAGEKPDHLCCELEFLAALLVMRACAARQQDAEKEDVTRLALASFAQSHLGEWIGSLAAHLSRITLSPAYAAIASALEQVWRMLCREHGWTIEPAAAVEPREDVGTPYECGMAEMEMHGRVELTLNGRAVTGDRGQE